jgi:hypothetical protein
MESDALSESSSRKVANLLALQVIEGKAKQEQVRLLALAGFNNNEIAALVETTPGSVRAYRSSMRAKSKDKSPIEPATAAD